MVSFIVILVYLVGLTAIGYWGWRRTQSNSVEDIFIASGKLTTIVIFLTSLATCFSAFAFLGTPGYFYSYGVDSLAYMAPIVADLVIMLIIGRGFWMLAKRYKFVTPGDLLSGRYDYSKDGKRKPGKIVRIITAVYCIFFSIFYIQLNFTGCGYVIETTTGGKIPYLAGLFIIAAFIGLYTVMGGMKAVAWTDAIQAVLLILGMTIISIIAVNKGGGGQLFSNLAEKSPDWSRLKISPRYAYSCFLGVAISMPIWPQLWVRYYAGKRLKGTVIGVVMGEGIGVIITCIFLPAIIGAAGLLLWPDLKGLDADRVTVMFLQFIPGIGAGIFAAGALAAAMSTADSITLMLGSIFVRDIYQQIKPDASGKTLGWVSRIMCLLIVVASLLLALNPPDLLVGIAFKLAWPGVATFFPAVVGALYWRRATREGAIGSLLVGVLAVILTTYVWPDALGIYSTVWGVGLGAVALIVISLMTPPPPKEVVQKYHGFLEETLKYKNIQTAEDVAKVKIPS